MVVSFLAAMSALVMIGFLLFPIIWFYAIYDAYKVAEAQPDSPRIEEPN